jgi:hypothetical protein
MEGFSHDPTIEAEHSDRPDHPDARSGHHGRFLGAVASAGLGVSRCSSFGEFSFLRARGSIMHAALDNPFSFVVGIPTSETAVLKAFAALRRGFEPGSGQTIKV